MAQSALSSVINQQENVSFGNALFVKRYLHCLRFSSNEMFFTFSFFLQYAEIQALHVQKLAQKSVMLVTLISGSQRAKTVHSVRISDINLLDDKVVIPIISLIKETKPTIQMTPLYFQTYNKEPNLCTVSQLSISKEQKDIKRYKLLRDTKRYKLFLTCIKPYKAASKGIISRWWKSIIKESCINIRNHTSHSSRAEASSCVKSCGVIKNHPKCRLEIGENFCPVLQQKKIEGEVEFQNYLLQDN